MKIQIILALLFAISLGYLTYGNYQAGSAFWDLIGSALLLSVPLALMYFAIGVFLAALDQKRSRGYIIGRTATNVYWLPRIAGILIILFVGLFSLDVFTEGGDFGEMLLGFLIHSIPSIGMVIVLILAWRRPVIGFFAFAGAAIFFLQFLFDNPLEQWELVLIFSGPMGAIALLFWVNWKFKKH